MVLINFLGKIIGLVHQPYRYPTPEGTVSFATETIAELTRKLSRAGRERIAGLGIAMPFQLWNWAGTVGAPADILDQWRTHDIRSEIAASVSFPVYIQNDASAACSAELVFGQAANPRDFLYFYVGYFIGGGVVLQGSLYTGQTGNAGALGTMPVPAPDGGIRQLIDVASIATLEKSLEDAGADPSSLWDSPEVWTVDEDLLEKWITQTARGLAHAIVSAESVIDFGFVLIDGWIPDRVRTRIVEATRAQLRTLDLAGIEAPVIAEGSVGHNARALGGASLALSQRFLVDQSAFLKDR